MRKALIFSITLLLISIGALIAATFIVDELAGGTASYDQIGESALSILQTYAKSQTVFSQVDQLAKYAAHEAVAFLARTGGVADTSCGTPQNIVWNNADKKCFRSETIDSAFEKKFREALREELQSQNIPGMLAAEEYDFYIEPNPLTIHGIAQKPVEVPIALVQQVQRIWGLGFLEQPREGESKGTLAFRPSFSVTIPYDLTVYDKLYAFADSVIAECQKPTPEEKQTCIDTKLAALTLPRGVRIVYSDGAFTVSTSREAYLNPYTQRLLPDINFALTIPVTAPVVSN